MTAASVKARAEKHRKAHRLVQAWVSPEMKAALDALAKSQGRSVANIVRRELSKITGVSE